MDNKYKLYITGPDGNKLSEPEIQFILSLAPKKPAVIEDIDKLIFSDDKIGYEYYYARQLQLNQSITKSKESGQYDLYKNIYLPVRKSFKEIPKIDIILQKELNNKIDTILKPFKGLHPLNPSDKSKLPSEIVLSVLNLCDKIPYIAPEGFIVDYIPTPTWKPNMDSVKTDAFKLGYFTGPSGQYFYTPLCGNGIFTKVTKEMGDEAKYQMKLASKSILLAYVKILEEGLKPFKITDRRIYYLERI